MKVWVLAGVAWLLVVGSAEAGSPARCVSGGLPPLGEPICAREFTARHDPRVWTVPVGQSIAGAITVYDVGDDQFIAGGSHWARYGPLRIRESSLHYSTGLRIRYRSVGGPSAFTFRYQFFR